MSKSQQLTPITNSSKIPGEFQTFLTSTASILELLAIHLVQRQNYDYVHVSKKALHAMEQQGQAVLKRGLHPLVNIIAQFWKNTIEELFQSYMPDAVIAIKNTLPSGRSSYRPHREREIHFSLGRPEFFYSSI